MTLRAAVDDRRRRPLSAGRQPRPLKQGRAQHRRLLAFGRAQILIARTAGQAVGFPHGRRADDLDLKIQVAHHPADDGELLEILLAKNSRVRRENVKELRHDRADAAKMSGPRLAAQRGRKRILLDRDRKIGGIHFVRRRAEKNIHAGASAKLVVIRFRPRIFLVITARGELERIHEDADRDLAFLAGSFARDSDQFEMTAMQRAHRRHEDSALTALARARPRL